MRSDLVSPFPASRDNPCPGGAEPDERLLLCDAAELQSGQHLLLLRDVLDLRSEDLRCHGTAPFAGRSHYGTLAIVASAAGHELADELHELLERRPDVYGSASAASTGVVVARVLGNSTASVRNALLASWQASRLNVLGQTLPRVPGKLGWSRY